MFSTGSMFGTDINVSDKLQPYVPLGVEMNKRDTSIELSMLSVWEMLIKFRQGQSSFISGQGITD
uniref:Uncharacterized protein n=1 Tax=Arion vulgaris TaxID=1028688 RepID=A0A0B7AYX9_9EUPU